MSNIYLRRAYPNELYHWGIKGQRWGVRRFQNPDGSLTPAGRKRYLNPDGSLTRKGVKFLNSSDIDKENRRNALRKESLKGTKAERAINELQKMGFKDDGSGIDDRWMSKKVNTKHGAVEIYTSIDRNSDNPVSGKDMSSAISGLEKHGTHAINNLKRELRAQIEKGEWGNGGVHVSGPTSMHVAKFNDSTVVCELSAAVQDNNDGGTYGWLSIDFDPNTGKMGHVYYND